jgi:hypothetical protein
MSKEILMRSNISLILQHYLNDNGSFTFYVDVFFPLSLPIFLPYLTVYMSNTAGVVLFVYLCVPTLYQLLFAKKKKQASSYLETPGSPCVYQSSWLFLKRVVCTRFDIIVGKHLFLGDKGNPGTSGSHGNMGPTGTYSYCNTT